MRPDLDTQLRQYSDHIVQRVNAEDVLETLAEPRHQRRPRVRGVVVAVGAAIAVLLLALPLLLSSRDDTQTPIHQVTSTTVNPMPDPDSWDWQQIDGTDQDIPTGAMLRLDGRLIAVEETCLNLEPIDCPPPADYWWTSLDGVNWTREPLHEDLAGYSLGRVRNSEDGWLIASDPYRPKAIFHEVGDQWARIDWGPESSYNVATVATRGDTTLVSVGDQLLVSDDLGVTFEAVDKPWPPGETGVLTSTSDGFAAYVLSGGALETWVSANGRAWEAFESPSPIGGEDVFGLNLSGRPGSYVAVVEMPDLATAWHSVDGLSWSRIEGIEGLFDGATLSVYQTDFGFVMMGFAPGGETSEEVVVTLLSDDGAEWHDVSDPSVAYTPGEVFMMVVPSAAGDRFFIVVSRDDGERTLWLGEFPADQGEGS